MILMHPIGTHLSSLADDFKNEIDQIESIFHRTQGSSSVAGFIEYIPTEEGCLFALWDAWSRYLRALVMTVAGGPCYGLSGAIYCPAQNRTQQEVLDHLKANKSGKRYRFINEEPNWHDGGAISDIATTLSLVNAPTVIGAVTATSITLGPIQVHSPLQEIRVARNFCAHKNWKTLQDIAAYSDTGFTTLSEHLREPRTGVAAFSEWTECLVALAGSAAQ